jgi:Zn finger protein HypA/HybF involved in hydrogenase expression
MTERNYVVGKKPDRVIPEDKIGKLEFAAEGDVNSSPAASPARDEISGRISPFWVKCWSCHKYLTRPLSPPSEQAYTCPSCGAVNML